MKKVCSLVVIALIIFIPLQVKAASSVSINCDKELYNSTDEAVCTLKGSSDENIISISGSLDIEDPIFSIIPIASSIWEGDADDGNIQLYTDVEKTGAFDIATIKVKLKEGATVEDAQSILLSVSDVMFGNVEGVEKPVEGIEKEVKFSVNTDTSNDEDNNNGQGENVISTTSNSGNDEVKNPSTGDMSIIIIGTITLIALAGIIIGVKKLKKIN